MLRRERFELQVGIVFAATLVFLVVGLLWAKRFRPQKSEMVLTVGFPSVGGLSKGDEVLVSGLRVGFVSDVVLRERDVLVTAKLDRKIHLYDGYVIRVATLTFTGEMGLAVTPGAGEPLEEPLPELRGTAPFELSDVVEPGLGALASVTAAADTVSGALPYLVRRAGVTLDGLDAVLADLDRVVGGNQVAVRLTLDELRATIASANRLLTTVGARLDTSLTGADSTLASLKATSDSLRHVLAALDTSRGTLGRMIHDRRLYDELRGASARLDSAAASIDSLARDMRQNPKRYVHFSLF